MLASFIIIFILFSLWCMLKVGKMADEFILITENNEEK